MTTEEEAAIDYIEDHTGRTVCDLATDRWRRQACEAANCTDDAQFLIVAADDDLFGDYVCSRHLIEHAAEAREVERWLRGPS